MSSGQASELLKTFANEVKGISGNRDQIVKKSGVSFVLGRTYPKCSFGKCLFSLKYVEGVKEDAKRTIRDLKVIKKFVKSDFEIRTRTGKTKKFNLTLNLVRAHYQRWWYFYVNSRDLIVEVSVNLYRLKYSPEIDCLFFPEEIGYENFVKDHFRAKEIFLKIIDEARDFYEDVVERCNERIEFLKQPVTRYEDLDKTKRVYEEDGVPRYLLYQKWENDFVAAMKKAFNVDEKSVHVSDDSLDLWGYFGVRGDDALSILRSLQGFSEARKLISCFPGLEHCEVNASLGSFFQFTSRAESDDLQITFPFKCLIKKKSGKESSVQLTSDVSEKWTFSRGLSYLENFIKSEFKGVQAVNYAKNRQRREKKMML